jgi:hypothetical protein
MARCCSRLVSRGAEVSLKCLCALLTVFTIVMQLLAVSGHFAHRRFWNVFGSDQPRWLADAVARCARGCRPRKHQIDRTCRVCILAHSGSERSRTIRRVPALAAFPSVSCDSACRLWTCRTGAQVRSETASSLLCAPRPDSLSHTDMRRLSPQRSSRPPSLHLTIRRHSLLSARRYQIG